MNSGMFSQITFVGERSRTFRTFVWSISVVCPHMILEQAFLCENSMEKNNNKTFTLIDDNHLSIEGGCN